MTAIIFLSKEDFLPCQTTAMKGQAKRTNNDKHKAQSPLFHLFYSLTASFMLPIFSLSLTFSLFFFFFSFHSVLLASCCESALTSKGSGLCWCAVQAHSKSWERTPSPVVVPHRASSSSEGALTARCWIRMSQSGMCSATMTLSTSVIKCNLWNIYNHTWYKNEICITYRPVTNRSKREKLLLTKQCFKR